jgi:hypothetical protein
MSISNIARNPRTGNIIFRLYLSKTNDETYRFSDVPYNIFLQKLGVAMKNEMQSQPANAYDTFATGLFNASLFLLSIEKAREIIQDLKQLPNNVLQAEAIEYKGIARQLHRGSLFQHHNDLDGISDAWDRSSAMNTGDYRLPYRQNQSVGAITFTGQQ